MHRKVYNEVLPYWNKMKCENNPSAESMNERESLRSRNQSKENAVSSVRRSDPFVWVSWISKLMAGEHQCQWASWFRSHYQWNKLPSSFDLARWTAEHMEMLRARRATLEAQGFTVYTEGQNAFKLTGETGIQVSGKPDIVAIREPETYVEDCKTGTPRHSDHFQVLVYMLSLPHMEGAGRGRRRLDGRIVYGNRIVDIPSAKIDAQLRELFRKTVLMIGGQKPARKVPSWGECQFCDISKADCPERIDSKPQAAGNHNLF